MENSTNIINSNKTTSNNHSSTTAGFHFQSRCSCFGEQCSDWPLQFILHGILTPLISTILIGIEIATLRCISLTMPLHYLTNNNNNNNDVNKHQHQVPNPSNNNNPNCSGGVSNSTITNTFTNKRRGTASSANTMSGNNNDDDEYHTNNNHNNPPSPFTVGHQTSITTTGDFENNDYNDEAPPDDEYSIKRGQKQCCLCLRTLIRVMIAFSSTKLFDFLKQDAHVVQYNTDYGHIVCYIVLYMFYISRSLLTFLELFASFALCELYSVTLLFNKKKNKNKLRTTPTRVGGVRAPLLKISGAPFFTGLVCIASTGLMLISVANYECKSCDDEAHIIQIERRTIPNQNDLFFALDVTFLSIMDLLSVVLFVLSMIGLFQMRHLADCYVVEEQAGPSPTIRVSSTLSTAGKPSGNSTKRHRFLVAFAVAMLAGAVMAIHQAMHHANDLATRLTFIRNIGLHADCFRETIFPTAKHCALDDYAFYCEQALIAMALLKLIDFLK